ncbi:unnamed protein product [Nesidiocoris tenuis]|uniref:Uncharacterized protein n=1 Tax=Nesidiocoris tenuis TaxID=355587 RepID=A0A6H5GKW8_9HEMI|nr:unnamed protein product [Nesidiocoris tenuis]
MSAEAGGSIIGRLTFQEAHTIQSEPADFYDICSTACPGASRTFFAYKIRSKTKVKILKSLKNMSTPGTVSAPALDTDGATAIVRVNRPRETGSLRVDLPPGFDISTPSDRTIQPLMRGEVSIVSLFGQADGRRQARN